MTDTPPTIADAGFFPALDDYRRPAHRAVFPDLTPPRPRRYRSLPTGHPASRVPLQAISVQVRGASQAEEARSIWCWTVQATLAPVEQWDFDGLGIEFNSDEDFTAAADLSDQAPLVAQMDCWTFNPALGDVFLDADAYDHDAADLAGALWAAGDPEDPDGYNGNEAFWEHVEGWASATPVLAVNHYTLDPLWRGSALTPALAAAMLMPFAAMGMSASVLRAHPMMDPAIQDPKHPDHLSDVSVDATIRKIAAMWRAVGYIPITEDGILGAALSVPALRDVVHRAGRHLPGADGLLSL